MKSRSGFVSNSSSSSFVMFLSKEMKTFDDVQAEIFPDDYNPDDIVERSDIYTGGERLLTKQMVVNFVLDEINEHGIGCCSCLTDEMYSDVAWEVHNCESKFSDHRNVIYTPINLPDYLVKACKKRDEINKMRYAEEEANGVHGLFRCKTPEQIALNREISDKYKLMEQNLGLDWDGMQKLEEKEAKRRAEELIEKNSDKVLYILEYSDDTAFGGMMEHCGILEDKLNAHRISHH